MKTLFCLSTIVFIVLQLSAETILADFSQPTQRWNATHSITNAAVTAEGLTFFVSDCDPWLVGPTMTFSPVPADTRRIRFALTCAPTDSKASWQLFYSFGGKAYSEAASCRLNPVGTAPYTRFEAEIPPFHGALSPPDF